MSLSSLAARAVCIAQLASSAANIGCSSESSLRGSESVQDEPSETEDGASDAQDAGEPLDGQTLPGVKMTLELGNEPVFVSLSEAVILDDARPDSEVWDLRFEGLRINTNGGASGPGQAAAFGPTDELNFLYDTIPAVPFLRADRVGGAFLDWYAYDSSSHSIWSRYHVYGVQAAGEFWKVQILGYYGVQAGAPVGALYDVRFAKFEGGRAGPLVELSGIDGTAGGAEAPASAPSGCLNLERGEVLPLLPAEASQSRDWHLCFRRDLINVNGGVAGPGAVSAVDLDAADFGVETDEDVLERTAETELERFDAVNVETLQDPALQYAPDGLYSAFAGRWYSSLEGGAYEPARGSWLVRGADGLQHYLIVFSSIEQLSEPERYRVELQVRQVYAASDSTAE